MRRIVRVCYYRSKLESLSDLKSQMVNLKLKQ